MTILITGGTGNVGLPLLDSLAGRPDIRALAHTPSAVEAIESRGIQAVRGDLADPASLAEAFEGVDRLFLLTPFVAGQELLEHHALDAAQAAGVAHVVKFAYAGLDWPIAITAAHRQIRDRLQGAPFAVTLLLADVFAANLLGQGDLLRGGQLVLPGPGAQIAYVDPTDVAQVAAALLIADQPPTGRVVVTGPELLSNQQAAALGGQAFTGSPATYVAVEAEPFAASLTAGGWPPAAAAAVAEMHTTIAEQGPLPVTDATRTYLHREATPLAAFLATALSA